MGRLYWITGLAGAGKSSVARKLYEVLKPQYPALVLLDGDSLRDIFDAIGQYEEGQRHRISMNYARLSQLLTSQGIDVICATISMFDDVRDWNRKHISNYTEIYLKVSFSVLEKRNQHGLYQSRSGQRVKNLVGVDIEAQFPKTPDIVLCNDGNETIEELTQRLITLL